MADSPFEFETCRVDEEPIGVAPEGPPEQFQPAVDAWIAAKYETTVQPGSGRYASYCGCYSTYTRDDDLYVSWTDAAGEEHTKHLYDEFAEHLAGIIAHVA